MIKTSNFGQVTRFEMARTIFGKGRYWTVAYLVDKLLIDTGCAHTARELLSTLEGVPVGQIVNTHSHEDHIGGNGILLKNNPKIKILAHPSALPVLEAPRVAQPLQPYRRLFWGYPSPSRGYPVEDGELIETERYRFQVFYTPGHGRDHICIYEPTEQWMFTGDLFVGGFERALRADYSIWDIIASLKKVASHPIRWLFPGCARVRENPQDELQQKIDYLQETGEKVLELNEKAVSVREIAGILFGTPRWIESITLGHFSRKHLVLSYLGRNSK